MTPKALNRLGQCGDFFVSKRRLGVAQKVKILVRGTLWVTGLRAEKVASVSGPITLQIGPLRHPGVDCRTGSSTLVVGTICSRQDVWRRRAEIHQDVRFLPITCVGASEIFQERKIEKRNV